MNRNILRRILEILLTSKKSVFTLVCESDNLKYKYIYKVDGANSKLSETVIELKYGTEYNEVYDNIDNIVIADNLKIKELTDERFNHLGNRITSRETLFIYRETEILLKVFRILQENCVFILANDSKCIKAFYINSRVFFIEESENRLELIDTDLFKLYSLVPRGRVVALSKLPRKYNCGEFIVYYKSKAQKINKNFVINKGGVRHSE